MPATTNNPFVGRWEIVETSMWDKAALDLCQPAHIAFGDDGRTGRMVVIAIEASVDHHVSTARGRPKVEFSFAGTDARRPTSGRR